MISLYQYPRCWDLPNASPFCMKLEVYLRLAKLPYEVHSMANPAHAPKGKLPFVKIDNEAIADSSFIIDYLKAKYGDALDQHLTPLQKAQGLMVQRMVEEHLYWVIVYFRWIDDSGWKVVKRDYFSRMPTLLRSFVPALIRRHVKKDLQCQGVGRHTRDEIYLLGKKDLEAIAEILGSKSFLFGDAPSSYDACIYAFLANILETPVDSPLKLYLSQQTMLVAYVERLKKLIQ